MTRYFELGKPFVGAALKRHRYQAALRELVPPVNRIQHELDRTTGRVTHHQSLNASGA